MSGALFGVGDIPMSPNTIALVRQVGCEPVPHYVVERSLSGRRPAPLFGVVGQDVRVDIDGPPPGFSRPPAAAAPMQWQTGPVRARSRTPEVARPQARDALDIRRSPALPPSRPAYADTRPTDGAQAPMGVLMFETREGIPVRYIITADDLLWMARALSGEGGDPATVAWALTQLFALQYGPGARFSDLDELIEMYNQSVSPRWTSTGDMCRPGGRYHRQENCSPTRMQRRERRRRLSWDQVPERFRAAALRWARGQLPNPVPRAVHFAATPLARRKIRTGRTAQREGWRELSTVRGNTFITTTASRRWPDNFVRIAPAPGVAQPAPAPDESGDLVAAVAIGAIVVSAGLGIFVASNRARRRA